MFDNGCSQAEIARRLGVNRSTVRAWCAGPLPSDRSHQRCPRCRMPAEAPAGVGRYAYLLGQYLGDGHLTLTARVPALRIACAASYPAIMDEVEQAMRATLAKSVFRVAGQGCYHVTSYSKHWPCLFPQAGPGRKHERSITLKPWQQEIVDAQPRALLRGLIHSDGCRVINRVTIKGREYAYPLPLQQRVARHHAELWRRAG